ncbi:hypothetical protein [Nonomuraea sp. NPDC049784]|uniref:hypothetical protein n=1 Tax=Nonomuraea sp. NPDC049784 TaxID=3154361 RepID=UPI003408004C
MNRHDNFKLLVFGVAILGLVIAVIVGVAKLNTSRVETITVKDKERVCDNSESCRYLIWDKDGDVYENTDAFLSLKFNSSDIYGELEEGHTYRVKVNGWRVQVTSSYPNILAIEDEVTK